MKKMFNQVLDLPQMVNQKFFKAPFNDGLDKFDSKDGIRCYSKTIYLWVAFALFVWMEFNLIRAAMEYLSGSHSGLEKAGAVLSSLLLFASAFPIAQVIRSRGESLGGSHKGMLEFVFSDFVKTNIRIIGEVVALLSLFSAFNFTLSFLLDTAVFNPMNEGTEVLMPLAPLASLPVDLMSSLLNAVGLATVSDMLHSLTNYQFNGGAPQFNGDFVWNIRDLAAVLGAFINVLLGLAMMYISLAIYGYVYGLASSLLKWVANPSLPISIKNK
ncbi:MAG: hypothetical protein ACKOWL_00155 [Sphingobacteriaceae bacterium]